MRIKCLAQGNNILLPACVEKDERNKLYFHTWISSVSSSYRKVQLQKSEDKRMAFVMGMYGQNITNCHPSS